MLPENVRLELRLADDVGEVHADRGQLEQVVMNLVVNARDAMPDGGAITLATAREDVAAARAMELGGLTHGPYVRLDVIDGGVGMDEETLGQIFEPFFTTKEQGKGTGLGLSTVYGIVQRAGGAVGVTSAPGHGARFSIHWPSAPEQAARASVPRTQVAPRARGETVLLVEDERPLREVVREVLQDYGYAVLAAGDLESAVRVSRAHPGHIDLLLSDVLLPNGSGPELAEGLAVSRPQTRVLFMSGYADESALRRVRGRDVALLAKPFSPDALARRVREVLDGG